MKRKVTSASNRAFYIVNTVFLLLCFLVIALPILNVIASSLSTPSAVIRGQVSFWPKGFNIDAYKQIFENIKQEVLKSQYMQSYVKNVSIYPIAI